MKRKILITAIVIVFGFAALFSAYRYGFERGTAFPKTIKVEGVSNMESKQSVAADFGTFWQAWQLINSEYLNNTKISDTEKVHGAINGLTEALKDPYSTFFDPQDNQKFQQDIQGNFGGIGAEIGAKNSQILIIAPLKDTPASRAGLQASDKILKINGTSTEGMTIDQAVNLIRGPAGTPVTLTILRASWDAPKDIKITRAIISAPTLDYEMKDGNIAYVQLYSFNANAESLFYKAMLAALSKNAQGVVLDLRNDPGGYLDVAVDLAGWFVPRGKPVVKEVFRNGDEQKFTASGNEALVHMPVVVLVNSGSASAAEILAGTLRDNRQAKLVGEQSFGKGTVQQLEELNDGSSLKLTIAHWVLPSGTVFENGGLKPDIEVKLTDDDITKKRDPQLDKALQLIKSEIARG